MKDCGKGPLSIALTSSLTLLLAGCAVSPETQALMDEFESTTPVCVSTQDCQLKWLAARAWTIENSDFPILTEGDLRIMASTTLTSNSGVGIVVTRDGTGAGTRIEVDVECLSVYGCPNIWELGIDFNRRVAAAQAN